MTLLEFLNAYSNRHGKVIIRDEYNNIVASGDGWAFVIEHAEYMKYEELHKREVDCFSVSDGTLYVRLEKPAKAVTISNIYGEELVGYADRHPLYNADPNCKHEVYAQCSGGVKCIKCGAWYCA